jgi:hypothetical protein
MAAKHLGDGRHAAPFPRPGPSPPWFACLRPFLRLRMTGRRAISGIIDTRNLTRVSSAANMTRTLIIQAPLGAARMGRMMMRCPGTSA